MQIKKKNFTVHVTWCQKNRANIEFHPQNSLIFGMSFSQSTLFLHNQISSSTNKNTIFMVLQYFWVDCFLITDEDSYCFPSSNDLNSLTPELYNSAVTFNIKYVDIKTVRSLKAIALQFLDLSKLACMPCANPLQHRQSEQIVLNKSKTRLAPVSLAHAQTCTHTHTHTHSTCFPCLHTHTHLLQCMKQTFLYILLYISKIFLCVCMCL